jgi:hypothetical protein
MIGAGLSRLCVIALMVLIVLSAAGPLCADYRSDYTAGLEAVQAQDWPEVERLMRAAAAGKGEEGRVRLYGMRFDPYIPHYFLGVALHEQGDCEGALGAWQISESQGFITKIDEYVDLQERRRQCRQRIARVEPTPVAAPAETPRPDVSDAVRAARARLESAEQAAAAVTSLRAEEGYRAAWESDPNLAQRTDQAGNTLRSARERFETGERTASEQQLVGAGELADRAGREFAAIRSELDGIRRKLAIEAEQRRDLEAALRQARGELATAAAAAREVLQRPDAAGVRSTQRDQLEGLLRQADGAGRISSIDRLRDLKQGIESQTTALERTLIAEARRPPERPTPEPTTRSAAPPRRLRTAAEAFFGGDYRRALSLLEGADFSDPRAVATSHLLRAGASFSLYLAEGENDEELRRTALAELRRCRRARPEIRLDPSLFSPRFVEFADSSR